MNKINITKVVILSTIALIFCVIFMAINTMFISDPAKNGSVRYVGEQGRGLVEWNGQIYGPVDSLAAFPNLKGGKYLGIVEGKDAFRAYKIKNDTQKEYLLICAGGWLMSDKVIYKVIT